MGNNIWEKLNYEAEKLQGSRTWSPFVTGGDVSCALESENGKIFTGINIENCCGVVCLCAERVAITKMVTETGELVVKRLLARGSIPPKEELNNWAPCGACREFLMQLSDKNKDTEIMMDFETGKTITLKELIPYWWGDVRFKK
ncbi:MAG: cytidine deaminase [Alphaproteobacteria bacterium]|nr:cytidine deaminase [Alphaproteobacteria bacterium]